MKVVYLQEWNTAHSWVPAGAVVEMTAAAAEPLITGGIVEEVAAPKPAPSPPKRGK